jgi:PPP family 3-phenylpropionic acid transporter
MLLVDRWIDRYGFWWVLAFGMLLEAGRWICYAFAGSAAELLLLAPWHGLAFASMHVAAVRGVTLMVPERMHSMGQGLATSAAGIGQVVGFVAAGYMTSAVGSRSTFVASAVIATLAVTLILVFARAVRTRCERRSTQ